MGLAILYSGLSEAELDELVKEYPLVIAGYFANGSIGGGVNRLLTILIDQLRAKYYSDEYVFALVNSNSKAPYIRVFLGGEGKFRIEGELRFDEEPFREYMDWQTENQNTLKKVHDLIKDIQCNGLLKGHYK